MGGFDLHLEAIKHKSLCLCCFPVLSCSHACVGSYISAPILLLVPTTNPHSQTSASYISANSNPVGIWCVGAVQLLARKRRSACTFARRESLRTWEPVIEQQCTISTLFRPSAGLPVAEDCKGTAAEGQERRQWTVQGCFSKSVDSASKAGFRKGHHRPCHETWLQLQAQQVTSIVSP